jgi:hypothetical protein
VTGDGTVIRTRMRVEGFADGVATPTQTAPQVPRPTNAGSNNGGREATAAAAGGPMLVPIPINTSADIEVTYRKPAGIDLWLPAEMLELYEGPVSGVGMRTTGSRSVTRASYANFKQFGASGRIVPQQ